MVRYVQQDNVATHVCDCMGGAAGGRCLCDVGGVTVILAKGGIRGKWISLTVAPYWRQSFGGVSFLINWLYGRLQANRWPIMNAA